MGRTKVDKFEWSMLKGKDVLGFRPGQHAASVPRRGDAHERRQPGYRRQAHQQYRAAGARRLLARRPEPVCAFSSSRTPSQLELDGKAYFLASIGATVGFADYTSFMATDKYIADNPAVVQTWTDVIYRAQKWTATASAADIVKAIAPFFPGVNPQALINADRALPEAQDLEDVAGDRAEGDRQIPGHSRPRSRARRQQAREVRRPRAHRIRHQGEVSRGRSAGAASPKVELRNVGLRYFGREGETEALQDISLSVAPGEFVAVIGPSGCGKSTLLSLISGPLRADRRRRAGRRPAGDRAEPQGRLHAAAGLSVRVAHHPGERGARRRNPGRRRWRGRANARRSFSPAMGSASSSIICRGSFPAACASAPRLPARCAPSPISCCSTSRFRRWIRRPGSRLPTRSPTSCGARPRP